MTDAEKSGMYRTGKTLHLDPKELFPNDEPSGLRDDMARLIVTEVTATTITVMQEPIKRGRR